MPFFNRLCSTSPLAAALAIRTNSAVVPAAIFTSGFARWRIVYDEEIPYDRSNPEQLTADINAVLERQIRHSPADWFWVHNRWKTPWPYLLIARQKRGIYLPPGIDPLKLHPFRFLIRSPNWLGDAVMSLRAARAFKHGRPDARLAVLAPAKLEAFWKSIAEVDEVISFATGGVALCHREEDTRTFRGCDTLPEFVSQRGRGMACRHPPQGGLSRTPALDAADSNHR